MAKKIIFAVIISLLIIGVGFEIGYNLAEKSTEITSVIIDKSIQPYEEYKGDYINDWKEVNY